MVFWVNPSFISLSVSQGWWHWSSETSERHMLFQRLFLLFTQSPLSPHHPGTSYCGHTQIQFWFQQVCLILALMDTKPVCIQALFFSKYFANLFNKPLIFPPPSFSFFFFPFMFRRYRGYFWAIFSSFLYCCAVLLNPNTMFYISCSLARWLESNAMKTLWPIKLMM